MQTSPYSGKIERARAELISMSAASRIANRDSLLFSTSDDPQGSQARAFGWVDLCESDSTDIRAIEEFASQTRNSGIEHVFLIGEGGSIQAASAIACFLSEKGQSAIEYHEMDSIIPVDIIARLASADPSKSLFIVSSKSGKTPDTMAIFAYVWDRVSSELGEEAAEHFVAISDKGTPLDITASKLGIKRFNSLDDVSGRFSALSVVGMLPSALIGANIAGLLDSERDFERMCGSDAEQNPAIAFAAQIYGMLQEGRDVLHLVCDEACRGFGLWAEQLVAESLGKQGKGILINLETGYESLTVPRDNSHALTIKTSQAELPCETDPSIPHSTLTIDSIEDMAEQFIIWEYAVAMLAALIGVNPFDQPDVESAKRAASEILEDESRLNDPFDVRFSNAFACPQDATQTEALRALFVSMREGGYCSINAFLPKTDEVACEALQQMRLEVGEALGCPVCLEMGPKYLHSVGQYHKGGPNSGAFIIISYQCDDDLQIPGEPLTFAKLVSAQATGDFDALSAVGRKVVHLNLASCDAESMRELKEMFSNALTR